MEREIQTAKSGGLVFVTDDFVDVKSLDYFQLQCCMSKVQFTESLNHELSDSLRVL